MLPSDRDKVTIRVPDGEGGSVEASVEPATAKHYEHPWCYPAPIIRCPVSDCAIAMTVTHAIPVGGLHSLIWVLRCPRHSEEAWTVHATDFTEMAYR